MSAHRYVVEKDVLTIVAAGGLAVARVVGIGGSSPQIQVRGRRGWIADSLIDEHYARQDLRPYAELAAWVRQEVLREIPAGRRARSCAPRRRRR
jgi:hypothetical protein